MDAQFPLLCHNLMLGVPDLVAAEAKRYPRFADPDIAEREFGRHSGKSDRQSNVFRGATGIKPSIELTSQITALADQACGEHSLACSRALSAALCWNSTSVAVVATVFGFGFRAAAKSNPTEDHFAAHRRSVLR